MYVAPLSWSPDTDEGTIRNVVTSLVGNTFGWTVVVVDVVDVVVVDTEVVDAEVVVEVEVELVDDIVSCAMEVELAGLAASCSWAALCESARYPKVNTSTAITRAMQIYAFSMISTQFARLKLTITETAIVIMTISIIIYTFGMLPSIKTIITRANTEQNAPRIMALRKTFSGSHNHSSAMPAAIAARTASISAYGMFNPQLSCNRTSSPWIGLLSS